MKEHSLVILKPDAVARGLVGEIMSRFEKKGLQLCNCRMLLPDKTIIRQHYSDLCDHVYFPDIIQSMSEGPLIVQVWAGDNAIRVIRTLLGATNPLEARPGTIRGDYAVDIGRNICHASDSTENAVREISIWFGYDLPYYQWRLPLEDQIYRRNTGYPVVKNK
jgi:nucleoside-diphosphate kinase